MCLTTRLVTLFSFSVGLCFAGLLTIPNLSLAQSSESATAIGTVGVGTFTDARSNRIASAVKSLSEGVVTRLNARTYLKAKAIGAVLSPGEKSPTLRPLIAKASVDGLLLAEVGDGDVRWNLIGSLGQVVTSGKVEAAGYSTDADLGLTADRIVDSVAASVPYRTYITREIGPDVYEINMGTAGGFLKGQRLRVFDFGGSDFKAKRTDTGVVEVVSVKEWTAEVEAVSGAEKIRPFQKIAFEERANGMALPEPPPSKGWVGLGGGMLTVASDSPAAAYDQKVFRLNSTPVLMFGLGYGKTELIAGFAQAQNTTEDLVFSEAILDRQMSGGGSGLWNWKFLAGLRFSSYMVTSDSVIRSQLESLTSLSPHLALAYEKYMGGPLYFLAGAEAMPLTYYSGNNSNILFSYGAGVNLGLRFDFSRRWTFDVTGRMQTFRRPVDGSSAVQERHSNVNALIKLRF